MERPKDLYVILGVSRDASPQAIRRAYKQLVERYGPEKGGPTNPEKYEELRAAFETLSDNDRRHRYDQSLQELEAPFAWTLLQDRPPETLRRPVSPGSLTGENRRRRAAAACCLSTCRWVEPVAGARAPAVRCSTARAATARGGARGVCLCTCGFLPAFATGPSSRSTSMTPGSAPFCSPSLFTATELESALSERAGVA